MSRGRGRLSRSSWAGVVSSSSMISLQRSMASSQMEPPGPAISFLTWRWLLPQKLQGSCSLPSVARAISLLLPRSGGFVYALTVGNHLVDDAVLLRFFRRHVVVALHVLRDLVDWLVRVQGDDLLEAPLETDRLPGLDLDIGALPLEAARDLVDQDLGIRQRSAFSLRAGPEEQSAHRHRDADTRRRDVRFDELNRVVDREPRVDRAARRVDVDVDVLVGILGLQMDHLGDDEVRDLVVDRGAEEDDPLVEQSRVDVEEALASRGLLDDGRDDEIRRRVRRVHDRAPSLCC